MARLVCEDCGEVLEENVEPESSSDGLDDRNEIDEIEDDAVDEFEDKLEEMTQDEQIEDTLDDLDEYLDNLDNTSDFVASVGKDRDCSSSRFNDVKANAERLSEIFKDSLRQKRKNKVHHEQRTGRFDSRRMVQADRGSSRVFKREEEGRDLDYQSYFVLDRSLSMVGQDMVSAEDAVGSMMLALEMAKVETELLELHNDKTKLIKTMSQGTESNKGNILRGEEAASGRTPLGKTMKMLSSRIDESDENTFVVVVTDGRPNDKEAYMNALKDIRVPILGVTVGLEGLNESERDEHFDFHAQCEFSDEVKSTLFDLARNVML